MVNKTPAELISGTPNDNSVVHSSEDGTTDSSKKHNEREISRMQGTAPLYSALKTYSVNDLITESGVVYRNIIAIGTPEVFDPANWTTLETITWTADHNAATFALLDLSSVNDSFDNEILKFTSPGSDAVNFLTATSSDTGFGPTLGVSGNDTNIDIVISGQGTGIVNITSDMVLTGPTTFPDDIRQIFNPGTTNAGINIGTAIATEEPSNPLSGDMYYDITNDRFRVAVDDTWENIGNVVGGVVNTDVNEIVRYADASRTQLANAANNSVTLNGAGVFQNVRGFELVNRDGADTTVDYMQTHEDVIEINVGSGSATTHFEIEFGGLLPYEFKSTHSEWGTKYFEIGSITTPGVTGDTAIGRMFMDSANSDHLSIIRNGADIDLEIPEISSLPDGNTIRNTDAEYMFEQDDITYKGDVNLLLNSSTTIIQIIRPSDIEDLSPGNVFTLTENTTIIYNIPFSSDVRFELNGFVLQIWNTMQNHIWTYTGGGNFISGQGSVRFRLSTRFDGNSTGTLFNMTRTGTINISAVRLSNWLSGGFVDGNTFLFRFTSHLVFGDTFTLNNVQSSDVNSTVIRNFPLGKNVLEYTGEDLLIEANITNVRGEMDDTVALVRIDPSVRADSKFSMHANPVVGDLFDNVVTNSGVFTAVADASIALTEITSVTDSSGKAQFNFAAGPTVYLGQRVTLTGYTTNTAYNVTAIIATTDGTTFFTLTYIAFGSDEATGDFTSDSVTLTETTTSAVDAEGISVITDLGIDYDVGSKVYNKLTNSFQINATFVATETGTWNNGGLDQRDPKVLASINPGHIGSEVLGGFFAVAQDLQNIGGTYADLDFVTGVTALIDQERSKLLDTTTGEIIYTGGSPQNLRLHFAIPYDKTSGSGNVQTFNIKFQIDRGAGYVDIPQGPISLLSVTAADDAFTSALQATILVNPGDRLKAQIIRTNGTNTVLAIKPMRFEVTLA